MVCLQLSRQRREGDQPRATPRETSNVLSSALKARRELPAPFQGALIHACCFPGRCPGLVNCGAFSAENRQIIAQSPRAGAKVTAANQHFISLPKTNTSLGNQLIKNEGHLFSQEPCICSCVSEYFVSRNTIALLERFL
jgi:hypothetical protein